MKKILLTAIITLASLGLFSCQDESKEVFEESAVTLEDQQATSGHLMQYDSWSD